MPEWLSSEGRDLARMMTHLGFPISDEGRLPGGDHWTLALDETDEAVWAHLMIRFADGGAINSGAGRSQDAQHLIDRGRSRAPTTCGCSHGWSTATSPPSSSSTPSPPAAATAAPRPASAIYDDDGQMRLFLIVVDDRDALLSSAVALDEHHHVLATVDLTEQQQEFTAHAEWVENVRRGDARAAGPPPHRMVDWPITQHVPDRPPPALT